MKNNFKSNGFIPIIFLLISWFLLPSLQPSIKADNTNKEVEKRNYHHYESAIFSDDGEIFTLNKTVTILVPPGYSMDIDLFEKTVEVSIDGINFRNWVGGESSPYPISGEYHFRSNNKNQQIQVWVYKTK